MRDLASPEHGSSWTVHGRFVPPLNGTYCHELLEQALRDRSAFAAEELCKFLLGSDVAIMSEPLADGRWEATVRFDHTLHEGQATSESGAIIIALQNVVRGMIAD